MAGQALVTYGAAPNSPVSGFHYTADDTTPVDVVIELGFRPAKVEIINIATQVSLVHLHGMALNSCLEIDPIAAGVNQLNTTFMLLTAGVINTNGMTLTLEAAAQAVDDTFAICVTQ